MDMTGWLSGQVFLQTVDEVEVEQLNAYLTERGLTFQVLTLSERMVVDETHPENAVSSDRFSIVIQLAGFPQVILPALNDLVQRAHGAGWGPGEPPAPPVPPQQA